MSIHVDSRVAVGATEVPAEAPGLVGGATMVAEGAIEP